MTPEQWRQIEETFHRLVDRPPSEQKKLLAQAIDDRRLRAEVERMLAADRAADGFLEPSRRQPSTIGPYRLLEELGHGGMGTVYLAQQEEPVRRKVAVKLLRAEGLHRQATLRFNAEWQALARVQHPQIAQILDAGTTAEGLPYLVMEYVPGRPLHRYCDDERLSLRRRLALFRDLCRGVQHLHHRGLLHRDLKPSNILVNEEEEGRPLLKIIDLGIAKAFDRPLLAEPPLTGDLLLGTPTYLSPEAIRAMDGGEEVDTRSDIYSLGVLLHELLVGAAPHGGVEDGVPALLQRILDEDPQEPWRHLVQMDPTNRQGVATARGLDARTLRRRLGGDLSLITLKALARDRSARYGSAGELAGDVERHLNHEPVLAAPLGRLGRARKFVRRNRVGVLAAAILLAILSAGFVGRSLELERANRAAAQAREEAERALAVSEFIIDMLYLPERDRMEVRGATLGEVLHRASEEVVEQFEEQPLAQATVLDRLGIAYRRLGFHDAARRMISQGLEIRHERLGDEHPETIAGLHNLATVLMSQDAYEEAEAAFLRAADALESTTGPDRLRLAETLNNLGNLYNRIGRFGEADTAYRRAIDIVREHLGPEDRGLARTWMNLGINDATRGRYADAEDHFTHALNVLKSSPETRPPTLAAARHNLAALYEIQGRYEEAETLYLQSLESETAFFGPDHPEVASTLNNLALVYTKIGRHEQAESIYLRSLKIKREALGENHRRVAEGLLGLGGLYAEQGRPQESESHYLQARAIFEQTLPEDHPRRAHLALRLARLYEEQQRNEQARTQLRRALDLYRRNALMDHPDAQAAQALWEALQR